MLFEKLAPGFMFQHDNQVWIKLRPTKSGKRTINAMGFAFKPGVEILSADDSIWRTWHGAPERNFDPQDEIVPVEMTFRECTPEECAERTP